MINIKKICNEFNLGNLLEDPIIVNGGITNKIYKVVTDKGIYALKVINRDNINNNSLLLDNIELSENISNIARNNNVNSVCALKINNKYIQEYKDLYILIYPWVEGRVLLTKEINLEHLKVIGRMLGNLHNIKVEGTIIKYKKIDYEYYYNLLIDNDEEWSAFYKEKYTYLVDIYEKVYLNYSKLSNQVSYVHKDLNRKNIMWDDNNVPHIIDWETATIGNPSLDFFNSAWFLSADVDYDKYYTFTKEYSSVMNLEDDTTVAAYSAIIDECNWLEFSLKRALGIHSNNIDEIELGKNSIKSSLTEIINYYEKVPLMLEIIEKLN
jgi:Ser/Thr protein kinase RdoA (MazF antagonist)